MSSFSRFVICSLAFAFSMSQLNAQSTLPQPSSALSQKPQTIEQRLIILQQQLKQLKIQLQSDKEDLRLSSDKALIATSKSLSDQITDISSKLDMQVDEIKQMKLQMTNEKEALKKSSESALKAASQNLSDQIAPITSTLQSYSKDITRLKIDQGTNKALISDYYTYVGLVSAIAMALITLLFGIRIYRSKSFENEIFNRTNKNVQDTINKWVSQKEENFEAEMELTLTRLQLKYLIEQNAFDWDEIYPLLTQLISTPKFTHKRLFQAILAVPSVDPQVKQKANEGLAKMPSVKHISEL